LRIRALQNDMARFARDLIRLKAEIICEFFSDDTIIGMSGAEHFSEADQPYVKDAIQLLRNDVNRAFRVDIESDSMVEADEAAEKQGATELLTGTADFMQKVAPVVQQSPDLAPLLMETFMFALRRYKVGKSVEGQYQETFDKITQQLQQPKDAGNQEAMQQQAMQMQQQQVQQQLEAEQQKESMRVQADMQVQQMKEQQITQRRMTELQFEAEQKERDRQHELQLAQLRLQYDNSAKMAMNVQNNETSLMTAQISANATLSQQQVASADKAIDG